MPVDVFKMALSQSNEDFLKSYNEDNDEGYFFEDDGQYPEELHVLHNYPFCLREQILKKFENM